MYGTSSTVMLRPSIYGCCWSAGSEAIPALNRRLTLSVNARVRAASRLSKLAVSKTRRKMSTISSFVTAYVAHVTSGTPSSRSAISSAML